MNNKSSRLGTVLLIVAVLAVLVIALMMFGARLGFWEPIVGLGLIRKYMNPIAFSVTGLGMAGLIYQLVTRNRSGAVKAGIAALIGVILLAPMISGLINPPVRSAPINDITTDTSNPPKFLVLDDNRPGARNTLVYGGAEVAAIQAKAYPDIAPIQSNLPASEAFDKALSVGIDMGWEIVAQDPDNYRFEATARTPVYYFADDIVVVVSSVEGASRIDIRSVSRVGRSDQGVNAARIREFTRAFKS